MVTLELVDRPESLNGRPAFGEMVADLAREARETRAELRQLERDVGQSASADGRYWLARTVALERIAATAERAVASGNLESLKTELLALREITAPACNANDHKGRT